MRADPGWPSWTTPVDVAMSDGSVDTVVGETGRQFLGDSDRSVMAPCAPDPDRQVGLPFTQELGDQESEEILDTVDEFFGAIGPQYVVADRVVGSTQIAELGHPMWVRQKSDVEEEVGVPGSAVLEPKGAN